ncbi:hypothetical protein ACFOUP_00380 [Belliella kenyensis]|uniref:Oligogalacturonide lyase n=1 Tax=Belliella kenyensis TaxID=1472724 RepID=A0ABV8EEY1_9BACT|nr:hypothetical protein [Belliella kenyensis]MCH7401856.1 hypothetical protein [Belliella kenyensis]MDN3604356.1 hypothetical protein [Belliella kenyensis]
MKNILKVPLLLFILGVALPTSLVNAQIGKRLPSERKVVQDPVTGVDLIFLTSTAGGDSKIYPTHPQWTADGEWLVFRSNRIKGEALAVNEDSGEMVQVTEGGYDGMLTLSQKEMRLYYMRKLPSEDMEVVSVNLQRLFSDSESGVLKQKDHYETIHGIVPKAIQNGGDMALDADDSRIYFKVNKEAAAKHLPEDAIVASSFGPRGMGAGPGGIASLDLKSGEVSHVISVPFQVGHVQVNPWVPGELVFCWETGGKAPQRTWTVMADGTGLRPLYPESEYEWVTHEAVISQDEVAMAIMGHRDVEMDVDVKNVSSSSSTNPGQEASWGKSGTREKPTGLAIVNLRTREMRIEGQTESGSGLWHVHGSPDGKWAVGDDFSRTIYLIDRQTKEMKVLSTGHKVTAADHPHPTFNPQGTKIQIQSAMLSEDDRTMNICVIPIPKNN